jgi:hypothetical protein
MSSYSDTRAKYLRIIRRGNAPQLKEIRRIADLQWPDASGPFRHTIASLAYYRLSMGSGSAYELSRAFHTRTNTYSATFNRKLPVQSDEVKRVALYNFWWNTKHATVCRWLDCLYHFRAHED